jgi:peptidoglycan/LPS O-acetylase OafA/YrhL
MKRYGYLDIMRGVSIVAMILIHTSAYFLKDKTAYFLWDINQFAVPVFIFCSAYLFYKKESHSKLNHTVNYYKKRVVRLMVPYYIFLGIYLLLIWYAQPANITPSFLVANLTLTGGLDLNWLVLLFLYMSLLMPVLMYLYRSRVKLFYSYCFIAVLSSIWFLFFRPVEYRAIMWLPWSLLIPASWFIAEMESHYPTIVFTQIVLIATYALSRYSLLIQHSSLDHYRNKYPPNLYHISFGVISIIILFYACKVVDLYLYEPFKKAIIFFSTYSYQIFFTHFMIIYFLTVIMKMTGSWETFYLKVVLMTVVTQLFINYLRSTLKRGPTI